mmetsp:Transcript_21457/g.46621  ORF Transcript_21457/g.46621 Transcript_21457/m.46621 type:complete len:705 (+) Transcript_21457:166-2280(+)
MNSFIDNALTRKPLQLVRRQAHLGDESRYTPVAILSAGEDTSEHDTGGPPSSSADGGPSTLAREAPLRHMSLFDLVAFGVGCTVGSGVFVLAGVAAHSYAGPSSSLSYLLAGFVASLSGLPYAELSAAFPLDGSTYSYAYITLGEVFAVIASLCQTLEYGVSGAAVARSWGNKFVDWVREGHGQNEGGNSLPSGLEKFLDPGHGINPMAAVIAAICTLVLMWGVQESKVATNIISTTKVTLVVFMIVAGFLMSSDLFPDTLASFSNWDPFIPPEFGSEGILDGASILFFAYLGFDCICNLSGEAKDPVKDVPKAVIYTLLIDGVIYMLAALALTAMLPYDQISPVSGFPRAFGANGWIWAEKLTAIGEIVVLPLVVLTSIQSQTRLFFAMSKDNIVPRFFGKLSFKKKASSSCCGKEKEDKIGNLTANVQFCGLLIIILATFVPFQYLDALISSGALLLFSLTDCCLLTIRYKCPSETFLGSPSNIDENASIMSFATVSATVRKELSLGRILILLNMFPFASGLCFAYIPTGALRYSLTGVFAFLTLCVTIYIAVYCSEISSTKFVLERDGYGTPGRRRFRTPLVPYLPSLGIYMNWFMIAHVGWEGIVMLIGYLSIGVLLYGSFCSGKSLVNASYQNHDASYNNQNILPSSRRSTSPPSGNQDLQQALLEEEDHWDESHRGENTDYLKNDLSEIEASKTTAFV